MFLTWRRVCSVLLTAGCGVACAGSSTPSVGVPDAATDSLGLPDARGSVDVGGSKDAALDSSKSATDAGHDAPASRDAEGAKDSAVVPDESGAPEAGGCGEFTGDTQPTCSKDGNSLGSCAGGTPNIQACTNGCLRSQPPMCMLASATNWSCPGSYGTTAVNDGNYYITSFGCYIDASGNVQTDPGDNCIPSCLSKALAAGLCPAGSSGPQCEEAINWFTADGARFGCLARLRVTNPMTGKSVIAVALDYGPGCSGENGVSHAVLDTSGRIDDYLFGGPEGASDRALVHVVQVDDSTPLGPE